ESLREHDLKGVACADIFFDLLNLLNELSVAGRLPGLERLVIGALLLSSKACIQSLLQQRDVAHCLLISDLGLLIAHIGGSNNVDLLADMIESQQAIKKHETAVGDLEIYFGFGWQLLNETYSVIGEETYGAAGERWQIWQFSGLMFFEQFGGEIKDIAPVALALSSALKQDL